MSQVAEQIENSQTGDGATAQDGSVAAGAESMAVDGNVGNDAIVGDKISGVDQQGQQVENQINIFLVFVGDEHLAGKFV